MDYYEYTNAKAAVYQLAHNAGAPSQDKLVNTVRIAEQECIKDGTSYKDTIRIMLYPIFDGLMYGNWPRL